MVTIPVMRRRVPSWRRCWIARVTGQRRRSSGTGASPSCASSTDVAGTVISLPILSRRTSTVHRHLGVDMRQQVSQSNAYSLNRGLPYVRDTAIIHTYQRLRAHLPPGAPGEWFAIYPPFPRGFGNHNAVWQYMNGGVGGHVAGELALGALENGYEAYGVDILNRLYTLGRRYGDRIWFAYTGSFPAPPVPSFRPVDLSAVANMDLRAGQRAASIGFLGDTAADGNDLSGLPFGKQELAGISFRVIDPAANEGRVAVGVSTGGGFPREVSVPVDDTAACIYLLHDAAGKSEICASIRIEYTDSSGYTEYLQRGRQLGSWWFPSLIQDMAGVAWSGPNARSSRVGAYWTAIDNPHPEKKIRRLVVRAADNGDVYALIAVSLADQKHYVRPKGESFGGPDNWAAATAMAALIQGLAGITDSGAAPTAARSVIAPRWVAAGVDSIGVTSRYPVSGGYVSFASFFSMMRRTV